MVSDVGYAGYVDDRNTTGLMYTPNRYLSLNASFMSVDPSGSINIHDPRTFNQYAYVAGNPLTFVDPQGLTITITDEDPSEAFGLVKAGLQPTYRDYLSLSGHTIITKDSGKLASEGDYGKALTMWISSQHTLSISTDFSWLSWFTSPVVMYNLGQGGGAYTKNTNDSGNGDSHIYLDPSAFGPGVDIGGVEDMSAARAMTHEIGHSMYAIVPGLFTKATVDRLWGDVNTRPGYGGNYQGESFPMAFETRIWEGLGGKPRLTYNDATMWDHGTKYVYKVPFF
jgi:RHS repeat-associated protein